jgi:hypothetical protein
MNDIVYGISTCKGRLEHVKLTSVAFLKGTPDNVHYLLVDFGCPQKTGQWVKDELSKMFPGRVDALLMTPYDDVFRKTVALNAGAKKAIDLGADYLLYFDADTLVSKGFWDSISEHISKEHFIIVSPCEEKKDLVGFLVLSKDMYVESGGFDEKFVNWGAEDLEYRLRLYGKHKFKFVCIDAANIHSIPHGDGLRTEFYPMKDIRQSNVDNFKRMRHSFGIYRREDLAEFGKMSDRKEIAQLMAFPPDSVVDPVLLKRSETVKRASRK